MVKRKFVQFFSACLHNAHFAGFFSGRLWQGSSKSVCVPVLNCYSCPGALGACPIGALQSSFSGVFLRFPFYVLGTLLLFGLLLGRVICGWLCPVGLMQELLYKIPAPKLPRSAATRRLSLVKYAVAMLFILLIPVSFYYLEGVGVPAFCKYLCPAGTLEAALPLAAANPLIYHALGTLFLWKLTLLIIFLISSIFIYRPFCRFLCPLGAFYSLFSKIALFGIKVDAKKCIHCNICVDQCLMDCRKAGDRECIHCGACLKKCPVQAISMDKKF